MIACIALLLLQEATVSSVEGDVEFRQPSKSKKWAKLAKDTKLASGDQIQTGLKSRCLLQVGESTLVLVRASSFATLSQAFIDKNKVEGELRLDVGSVFIEVDPQKREQVDFKVSTPMGTASIRGSGMLVTCSELGLDVQQTRGTIFAQRGRRPESHLNEHARQKRFGHLGGGDLAALIGLMLHLQRMRDGDPPPQTIVSGILQDRAFRGTLDFSQAAQDVGFSHRPRFHHTGTQASFLTIGPFVAWGFEFIPARISDWEIIGLTKLSNVSFDVNLSIWSGLIGPKTFWTLRNLGTTVPQWQMTFPNGRVFEWNAIQTRWIPQ